jgi:SAM-dependent methyltransferase
LPTEPDWKPENFDDYAENYDEALNRGLSVTGEDKQYFARERILCLSRCLQQMSLRPKRILDYGCGTGSSTGLLLEILQAESAVGVDSSARSLEQARHEGTANCQFLLTADYSPSGEIDLVYCNGVFHHIPPAERAAELNYILKSLRPGGVFSLWENNPWNPGTVYVMSRIPFDRDAVRLSPPWSRRLLQQEGFTVLCTDFKFFFPRALKRLRSLEPLISWLPVGGQYQVLAQRPAGNRG